MKPLDQLLRTRKPVPQKIRGPRDELIQKFTDRLNQARVGTKFKPLTCRAVAVKLSHLPTSDLWPFYRQCESARSFSAYFWWALRPL